MSRTSRTEPKHLRVTPELGRERRRGTSVKLSMITAVVVLAIATVVISNHLRGFEADVGRSVGFLLTIWVPLLIFRFGTRS